MRREVFLVVLQNPEAYSLTRLDGNVTTIPNLCQPPKVFLGISVNRDELGENPPLPILRRDLVGALAHPITQLSGQEDRLIAILIASRGADCSRLRDCTLEEALDLCEL